MSTQDISASKGEAFERITVLEALAEPTQAVGISRSNASTPTAADADDQ